MTIALLGLLAGAAGCGSNEEQTWGGGETVDVAAMTEQLKSPTDQDRVNACIELAKAAERSTPAVPSLIEALNDQNPLVKRLAAYALGEVGPAASEAIPGLQKMMQSGDPDLTPAAFNALKAIDPSAVPDVQISNTMN